MAKPSSPPQIDLIQALRSVRRFIEPQDALAKGEMLLAEGRFMMLSVQPRAAIDALEVAVNCFAEAERSDDSRSTDLGARDFEARLLLAIALLGSATAGQRKSSAQPKSDRWADASAHLDKAVQRMSRLDGVQLVAFLIPLMSLLQRLVADRASPPASELSEIVHEYYDRERSAT
jgi:hypothetical protein